MILYYRKQKATQKYNKCNEKENEYEKRGI